MGSMDSPKAWVPYINKDCSQGFCSLYCPQWCYIIYPPPPPIDFPDDNSSSSPNFSPLVVAIIGILVSAFLLVSYYTIISKYCGNSDQTGRGGGNIDDPDEEFEDTQNPLAHEPWHVANSGLDEALIKSIRVCKFKKGDGFVEGSDCSVCLSEFEDGETVRLLPKCSHAFHIPCIDTWLRSHSNCPLCRAQVVCGNASTNPLPQPTVTESSSSNVLVPASQPANGNEVTTQEHLSERASGDEETDHGHADHLVPKASSLRAFSDLGNLEERHTIIEIRDEMRRSVSMDHSGQNRVLISDILRANEGEEDVHVEEFHGEDVGSSKLEFGEEASKNCHRKGILQCVKSPVDTKRSISSGRFLFTTKPAGTGRGRHAIIPL
ncbi:hypothetical protein UlMin_001154 [Ulmus minor]